MSSDMSRMSMTTLAAQTVGVSVSLLAAGGIATLSIFDAQLLKSQEASRSLPSIRWLFSRGSHIFPHAAGISSACFVYAAFASLTPNRRAVLQLLQLSSNDTKVNGYLLAAVLSLSIWPFTGLMFPTNFALIKKNEEYGGARSGKSAAHRKDTRLGDRSVKDSISGEGDVSEFTDLSGPSRKTEDETSRKEDDEVKLLLERFSQLNLGRACLLGAGGIVGLLVSLGL